MREDMPSTNDTRTRVYMPRIAPLLTSSMRGWGCGPPQTRLSAKAMRPDAESPAGYGPIIIVAQCETPFCGIRPGLFRMSVDFFLDAITSANLLSIVEENF